jgi:cell division control protein 7
MSQHPSNPLELSSDPHAQLHRLAYLSSDDPLSGYYVPDAYKSHVEELMKRNYSNEREEMMVDLDDIDGSDDELRLAGMENTPGSHHERDLDEVDQGDQEEQEDKGDDGEDDLGYDEEDDEENDGCDGIEDDDENGENGDYSVDVAGAHYDDAESSTDEEMSILVKSSEEREEIITEIADLEGAVPQLSMDYEIVDRLGTGTFSSVYKAIDIGHGTKWNNSSWSESPPPPSSARRQNTSHPRKVFVAIKRIYVTSSSDRIRNEISIMEDCRGCRHTAHLVTAFRHQDQVVVVMPFQRNDDFRVSSIQRFTSNY